VVWNLRRDITRPEWGPAQRVPHVLQHRVEHGACRR